MQQLEQDPLWQQARQRAAFKKNLTSYFAVNAFLVVIWYFTIGRYDGYFWPLWPMLGWGFGLLMQYLGVYRGQQWFSAEKEYEDLKKKQP